MTQIRKNILELIQDQHELLKDSIEVLSSEEVRSGEKRNHLEKFLHLLKMHADAEEQTLYSVLRDVEDVRPLVFEADEEHGLAKILVSELEGLHYKEDWNEEINAKSKVLCEVVKHHLEEEEKDLFRGARETLTPIELQALADEFRRSCENFEESELEIGQVMNQRRQIQESNIALSPSS